MALGNGPKFGLLINGAPGDEHYNELMKQWRLFEALVQPTIISAALTAPPGSPSDGDTYIPAATATGAWAAKEKHLARFSTVLNAWEFVAPQEGWEFYNEATTSKLAYNGSAWAAVGGGGGSTSVAIPVAVSDEATALTTGTAKVTFRMPHAMTVTAVRASLTIAQTSGSIFTVDINEGGTSILSTKVTIDNTEKTSTTATTAAVVSDSALADDAEITIDIDQVGDGTAKGLKVYLIGTV